MSAETMNMLVDGVSHHQSGRLVEACRIYQQVIEADPSNHDAENLLALAEYQSGRPEAALPHIERALSLVPEVAQFRANRGLILNALDRNVEAREAYLEALELEPGNLDARSNLANLDIEEGKLDEARLGLIRLLEDHPLHHVAHNNLGLVYKLQGEMELAVDAFRRAVEINPDYFDAFNNLGNLYSDRGEVDAAIAAYQRAVELRPQETVTVRGLGLELLNADRFEEARAVLESITAGEADDQMTRLGVAAACLGLGDMDEAETLYRQILEADPAQPSALNNLGAIQRTRSYFKEALALFDRAVEAAPDLADSHLNRGVVLVDFGRFGEAELALKKALELDPTKHAARERLAVLYDHVGNRDALEAVLAEWLELDGDNPVAVHLAAAMGSGEKPSRCSPGYVEAEFDKVASHFDIHLANLEYRLPEVVEQELPQLLRSQPSGSLTVLDLGCGTGAAGPRLRPWAKRLVGVDLSSRMLSKALARGCYDDLVREDVVGFLSRTEETFELCAGLDLLIYLGALNDFFSGLSGILVPGGMAVLSFEDLEDPEDYVLLSNGRFSHSRTYVDRCAHDVGLEIVDRRSLILRMEKALPVWGDLVWLKKGP